MSKQDFDGVKWLRDIASGFEADGLPETAKQVAACADEMERLRSLVDVADVALTLAVRWAQFTRQHWDANRDSKVGKCLLALSGDLPGYAPDTDGIHAYWQQIKDYRGGKRDED